MAIDQEDLRKIEGLKRKTDGSQSNYKSKCTGECERAPTPMVEAWVCDDILEGTGEMQFVADHPFRREFEPVNGGCPNNCPMGRSAGNKRYDYCSCSFCCKCGEVLQAG
jgi:hypothetical protein